MSLLPYVSTESLKQAFEEAKVGIDPEVVTQVMKGLPTWNDSDPVIRNLRHAWVKYHERIRV